MKSETFNVTKSFKKAPYNGSGRKLTVVLEYYEAMETYSRIGILRSYGNLQSYWTTTKLWKLTVVLDHYEAMETYSRIEALELSVFIRNPS